MNKASFLTLVRQASRISDQDAAELEKLVVNFPYCQTAHLLIAKAAYDQGSMLSNQKLKKAAIYAANRQLLKKLIFTSDASVSLQPLQTETPETVAEMPLKPAVNESPAPTIPETETPETVELPEAALTPPTEEAENNAAAELLIADETLSETDLHDAEGEKLLAETKAILARLAQDYSQKFSPETSLEFEKQTPETPEEGRLPEREADFVAELNEPETFVFTPTPFIADFAEEIPETEALPENKTVGFEAEKLPVISEDAETVWETAEKPEESDFTLSDKPEVTTLPETTDAVAFEAEKTVPETPEKLTETEEATLETNSETANSEAETETNVPEPEIATVSKIGFEIPEPVIENDTPEFVTENETEIPATEVETAISETAFNNETEASETVGESAEKVEELVSEAAHTLDDVPGVHELFLENAPESLTPQPENVWPLISEETGKTSNLHDDLLHETLASFDQYLFKPEKEPQPETEETPEPADELTIVYPQDEVQHIYEQDKLGYWMSSSRLGESLQLKDELTSARPYEFHPELIWEYSKTNELRKEIKPAPSKLTKQLEIIDEFLKLTPRLKVASSKVKTEAQEDLSSKSSKINKNLASENFANILVQQGKIKKAIKIYEHLILKIPEKKAYFVAQIEKLQNQN